LADEGGAALRAEGTGDADASSSMDEDDDDDDDDDEDEGVEEGKECWARAGADCGIE
jgi:phosphopantothenoylcysteine synthetase/decarboxylase